MRPIIRATHPVKSGWRRGLLLRASLCLALWAFLTFAPLRAFACSVVAPIGSPGQSGAGVTVN
jgi:hypothetical protein